MPGTIGGDSNGVMASAAYATPDSNLINLLFKQQLINMPPHGFEDRAVASISDSSNNNKIAYIPNDTLPTVINFYTKNCPACKIQNKDLDQIKKQFGRKIRILHIDCHDRAHAFLVRKYQVSEIPALVYLDSRDQFVVKSIGYSGMEQIIRDFRVLLRFEKIYTRALSAQLKSPVSSKK